MYNQTETQKVEEDLVGNVGILHKSMISLLARFGGPFLCPEKPHLVLFGIVRGFVILYVTITYVST